MNIFIQLVFCFLIAAASSASGPPPAPSINVSEQVALDAKVPYIGATADVNLGTHTLTTTGQVSAGTMSAGSAIYYVSSPINGDDGRATIQAAINAAPRGATVILANNGTHTIGGPIDLQGRNFGWMGNIRPTAAFSARTMADGTPNVSALLYQGGAGGVNDGGHIIGNFNTDNYDLDCSDSGNVARAEFGILINGNRMASVGDIMIRRAIIANIAIAGDSFGVQLAGRLYLANSPYAIIAPYNLDSYRPALPATGIVTGSNGNIIGHNIYITGCATGVNLETVASATFTTLAADGCALAMRLSTGKVLWLGGNVEGSRRVLQALNSIVHMNGVLVTKTGTNNLVGTDTYAGTTTGAGVTSDYKIFEMTGALVKAENLDVNNAVGTADNLFYLNGSANKLALRGNKVDGVIKSLLTDVSGGGFGNTLGTNPVQDDHGRINRGIYDAAPARVIPVLDTTNLITNGDFATNLDNWDLTTAGGGSIAQDAGTIKFTQVISGANYASQDITTVVGEFYKASVTLTAKSAGHAEYTRLMAGTAQNGTQLAASSFFASALGTYSIIFQATGTTTWITIEDADNNATTSNLDNVVCYKILPASMVGNAPSLSTNIIASVGLVAGSDSKEYSGLIISLDSLTNPQNFVVAFHDGTNAHLQKFVAGVMTSLINTAATYVPGASLRLTKSGTTYTLYYNEVIVDSAKTVSDAGIVSNTLHQIFSSSASSTPRDFSVVSLN